ncbi:hypothetical protein IMZ48_21645 [Candidatus Bathyarchaeota archaeon]|nr:hypothetical protein [Candidatus Bathyarchaeota archaeon]
MPSQPARGRPPQSNPILRLGGGLFRTKLAHQDVQESQHQSRSSISIPEEWPKVNPDDPLNVRDRVNKQLQKDRGAVKTVHELAALITTCCVDVFDPHRAPEEYRFFDFFERSINRVVR